MSNYLEDKKETFKNLIQKALDHTSPSNKNKINALTYQLNTIDQIKTYDQLKQAVNKFETAVSQKKGFTESISYAAIKSELAEFKTNLSKSNTDKTTAQKNKESFVFYGSADTTKEMQQKHDDIYSL